MSKPKHSSFFKNPPLANIAILTVAFMALLLAILWRGRENTAIAGFMGLSPKAAGIYRQVHTPGLRLHELWSALYPTENGQMLLVMTGEAENTRSDAATEWHIQVELRDADKKIWAHGEGLVGEAFTPEQLGGMRSLVNLQQLIGSIAPTAVDWPARSVRPYMVVVPSPPRNFRDLVPVFSLSSAN